MSSFNRSTFNEFVLLLLEYRFIVTLLSEETSVVLNLDYVNFNANNLYAIVTYREIQKDLEHYRDILFEKLFS